MSEREEGRAERTGLNERHTPPLVLFMGVARVSVGRAFNVKPVLSFTRFKGVVTTRNHAARVPSACRQRTVGASPFHFGIR